MGKKRFTRFFISIVAMLLLLGQTVAMASPGSFYDDTTKKIYPQDQAIFQLESLLNSKTNKGLWLKQNEDLYINYALAEGALKQAIADMGGIPPGGFTAEQIEQLKALVQSEDFLADDAKKQELAKYWSFDKPVLELESLTVQPNMVVVQTDTQVRVTIQVPYTLNDLHTPEGAPSPVQLWVKRGAQEWEAKGFLLDDGDLANHGDEIKNDQVYSNFFSFNEETTGSIQLKATVETSAGLELAKESSIQVVATTDGQSVQEIITIHHEVENMVDEIFNSPNPPSTIDQVLQQLQQLLQNNNMIQNTSSSDNVLEIHYANGLTSFIAIQGEEERGGITAIEQEATAETSPETEPVVETDKEELSGGSDIDQEDLEQAEPDQQEPESEEPADASKEEIEPTKPVQNEKDTRNGDAAVPVEQQTRGDNVEPVEVGLRSSVSMMGLSSTANEEMIGSRNVMIWAPFAAEFSPYDETQGIINTLGQSELGFDYTVFSNQDANVASLKNMTDYGLIVLATHGAGGRWVGTGEIVTDNKKYEAEQTAGQMAIWQNMKLKKEGGVSKLHPVYAVNEKWFDSQLNGSFNKSIIVNNSCESTITNILWNTFQSKGAGAYYGYNKVVGSDFAVDRVIDLVHKMAVLHQTTGEAYDQQTGSNGAVWQMRGNPNLKFPAGLVNGSFEKGMQAWEKDGDGRVISGLGFLQPVHGSRMGIISTGLGYTIAHGSIEQTFQVPSDATTLSFNWNYLSEEFIEWIGTAYDDPFKVTLEGEHGVTLVLDLSVTKIANQFGAARYIPGNLIHVSPTIVFDQGDVWMTDWQFTEYDISALQGQKVTLRFYATDEGDTIYSTAVLLDNIKVE